MPLLFGLLFSASGLAVLFIFTNIRAAPLALDYDRHLSARLHADEADQLAEYLGRRDSGRAAPAYRLGGRRRTLHARRRLALSPFCGSGRCRTFSRLHGCIAKTMREQVLSCSPNYDPEGFVTARQALLYSGCLLIASLTPALFFYVSAWYFFGALALGDCLLRDGAPLPDPAQPRFGSNAFPGVDPLSSFAPRPTCGRTPMNEQQAQFPAHALSLAFRQPLCATVVVLMLLRGPAVAP